MFSFYCDGVLIGHSELESGDAPMGIAFGMFRPTDAFGHIRSRARLLDEGKSGIHPEMRVWEGLEARTPDHALIECSGGGIVVVEYGASDAPDYLEAKCLGISSPNYETIFPQHVAAYEAQFPKE